MKYRAIVVLLFMSVGIFWSRELYASASCFGLPRFEEWDIFTSSGETIKSSQYAKRKGENDPLYQKGLAVRAKIEETLLEISRLENLSLEKFWVTFFITEEDCVFEHKFIGAEITPSIAQLIIHVRSDFDPERDGLILELVLAHEAGHFAHAAAGGFRRAWDDAWGRVFASGRPRAEILRSIDKDMDDKAERFSAGFLEKKEKLRALMERMEREVLDGKEAEKLRREILELSGKLDEIESRLRVFDRQYYFADKSREMLRRELYPLVRSYMLERGGPEAIADFFMAKWSVRRGVKKSELEAALSRILDGSSGHSSATLHIADPGARRDLILWYYDNISQNSELWLNLLNTENTFRNYVEPLYAD